MQNKNEEKKFYVNRYEYTGETIDNETMNMLMGDLDKKVNDNNKKRREYYKTKFWEYNYKPFDKNKKYTLDDFEPTGKLNNTRKYSNYEQYVLGMYRLFVSKVIIQALGLQVAIYWAEMARMSLYKKVNDYGFFTTSKDEIYRDIGLSPKQQDKVCEKLISLNVLETYTFKKEMRKFYKFNDDVAKDVLLALYKSTFRNVKCEKYDI